MQSRKQENLRFFATTPAPMSAILARELESLGAKDARPRGAGVEFYGSVSLAYRLCLWSRLASRILLPIARFPAADAAQLYAGGRKVDWDAHMGPDDSFAISCSAQRATIQHTGFATLKLKDALVDHFRDSTGRRPNVATHQPQIRLQLHLAGSEARVALDLSGESLHRRGYRQASGPAPLKETLAAAILTLADWPQIAASGGAFVDPMCGSGTLLMEALLMAADIAPGSYRQYFGFLGWRQHRPELWQQLQEEAAERRIQGLTKKVSIIGSDLDPRSVELTQACLQHANLIDKAEVVQRPLGQYQSDICPAADCGLLAGNPPYGKRLSHKDLAQLYQQLGRLRQGRFRAWQFAFITPLDGPPIAGSPTVTATQVKNGPLDCCIHVFAPQPEAVSVTAQNIDTGAFRNRIIKNFKHRKRWAQRNNIHCYRLYDADLPDFAIAVDVYEADERWLHVQEYAAPKSIDPELAQARKFLAMEILGEVLEIPLQHLVSKNRQRQRGAQQYQRLNESGENLEVDEGACRFIVNLHDHLDTGLFLDHRPLRMRIHGEAKERHFLNLFAYTATASVHAALGGAASTLSVDMSANYRDWGLRNLALNRCDRFINQYIQADCLQWLRRQAQGPEQHFDMIFCDPPTFSNSKRMRQEFDVQRDHARLIADCVQLLSATGVLYFSANRRGFRLDTGIQDNVQIEDISRSTIPEDFYSRPNIHQTFKITK